MPPRLGGASRLSSRDRRLGSRPRSVDLALVQQLRAELGRRNRMGAGVRSSQVLAREGMIAGVLTEQCTHRFCMLLSTGRLARFSDVDRSSRSGTTPRGPTRIQRPT